MILGKVNAFKQAVITLDVKGDYGVSKTVEAVIDTGYNGSLTITPALATELKTPFREIRSYELGSGELVDFPIHDATVLWNENSLEVAVLVTEGGVLVGMSLLTGFTLFIDAVDGGKVRIEPRS